MIMLWALCLAAGEASVAPAAARYVVAYKDSGAHRAYSSLSIAAVNGTVVLDLPQRRAVAAVLTAEGAEEMRGHPHVASVEEDAKRYMTFWPGQMEPRGEPYGIGMVQADEVEEAEAPEKKVCIIDSGLDMGHPEFASQAENIDGHDDIGGAGVWSVDDDGHGTHIAGTIFAPANGEGVVGINRAGRLKVHIVKVFDENTAWSYSSTVASAVDRCVAAGASVLSMSFSGGSRSSVEAEAFRDAWAAGVLSFAAAGNDGEVGPLSYPASHDDVVSVASVDEAGVRAESSMQNQKVELSAPGVWVLSTMTRRWGAPYYATLSGTSMACPHAAGVAALVWNRVPHCSVAEVRAALQVTAKDLGPAGRDDAYGHGLVQARDALEYLQDRCGRTPAPLATPAPDAAEYVSLTMKNDDGKTVHALAGRIEDGWPTPYPLVQLRTVTVVADAACTLRFLELDMDDGGDGVPCAFDYLEVRSAGRQVGTYCGRGPPPAVVTPRGGFTVEMRSDDFEFYLRSGFVLTFECGGATVPPPTPKPTTPTPTRPPTPAPLVCADLAPNGNPSDVWFINNLGAEYGCAWLAADAAARCDKYGGPAGAHVPSGMTGQDACCVCGGGTTGGDTPAPTTPVPPTPVPTTSVPATAAPEPEPLCADVAGEAWCEEYESFCRFSSFHASCLKTCKQCPLTGPAPSVTPVPPTPRPTPAATPSPATAVPATLSPPTEIPPTPSPPTAVPLTSSPPTPSPPTPAPTPPPTPTPTPVQSCTDAEGEAWCKRYESFCRFTSFHSSCRNTCRAC